MGKKLNLKNPRTFTEKIQWLKLYNRKPEYTQMVDKAMVKDYVAAKIGNEYIIPTLAVWDKLEDIDLSKLPEKFVLKTTNGGGGGGVAICRDKSNFNLAQVKNKFKTALNRNAYIGYKEWPYKNIKPRIIAEELIELQNGEELKDYKFFCFDGKVKFFKVDFGRFIEHHANYYDMDWNLLSYGEICFPPVKEHIETPPENFDEMIKIASKLSQGHSFLRIDLYNVKGKIYFGEMTFFPSSGFTPWINTNSDLEIGEMIKI